jgi:RNA polymerase sigma-70 factor (ECF subfamily)
LPADEPPADAEPVDDSALVARVRAGDVSAFDTLVHRHLRRAFSLAYRVLRHREDAEDLVQDAFMIAYQRLDTFEEGRPFAPWFMRILLNRALNARKARAIRRTDDVPDDAAAVAPSPDREAEASDERARVRRALARLPERQRLVLEMFELEGYSAAEVGAILDISVGTVRWYAHEARAALRRALAEDGVTR